MIYTDRSMAKINLFLHMLSVCSRTGYHNIESLIVFVDLADTITVDDSYDDFSVVFRGAEIDPVENTVYKAGMLLASHHGIVPKARVEIEKVIPIGAGLGGGSANAATALSLLQKAWRLPSIGFNVLAIGADVPVFIGKHAAFVSGIGGDIEEFDCDALKNLWCTIVWPGVGLGTADVYRKFDEMNLGYDRSISGEFTGSSVVDIITLLSSGTKNSLYEAALAIEPGIATIVHALNLCDGCVMARMTGSGSAVFGLFTRKEDSLYASRTMEDMGYWSCSAALEPFIL